MKYGYKVLIDTNQLSGCSGDEEYEGWSSSYDNSFKKITLMGTCTVPDVISDFKFKVGDKAYLVWLDYTTGDSFGHSERGAVECIGLFKDKQSAEELVKELKKPGETSVSEFNLTTSDGQQFKYEYCPWSGYFERLENVFLEEVIIEDAN